MQAGEVDCSATGRNDLVPRLREADITDLVREDYDISRPRCRGGQTDQQRDRRCGHSKGALHLPSLLPYDASGGDGDALTTRPPAREAEASEAERHQRPCRGFGDDG